MQTKTVFSAAIVLVLAAAGISLFIVPEQETVQQTESAGELAAPATASDAGKQEQVVAIPDLASAQQPAPSAESFVQQMIVLIQSEFGDSIQEIKVQVGLKDFRDDLIRTYPGQGEAMFQEILRAAFPELADLILARIALMDDYERWLLAAMPDLNQLDLMSQQNMLWEKRIDLFGDDARKIWQREMSAEEERNESVRKTVAMLDTAYDLPLDERLYLLQNTFQENYSQSMSELVYDTSSVLTQVFFRFDSVQRDLAAMEDEARQETINDIRRQIGYSEEQIAEMAEQDQKKEARWQNGYAYMEERRTLMEQDMNEQERQERVAQLRQKYFGPEAYTIGKEEEDLGFFRYERPRVYGWN